MNVIIGLLLGLFVLVALFLVLLILIQDDGTEGAGIIFGSAASQQYGARKGNVLTRTTSILASLFIVIAFSLSFVFQYNSKSLDIIDDTSLEETKTEWWDTSSDNAEEEIPLETPETSIEDSSATTSTSSNFSDVTQSNIEQTTNANGTSPTEGAANSESTSQ